MSYYLGIDLGTSSIKLSLADDKGNILDSASKDYPLYLPKENWSEQDPNLWYKAMLSCFDKLNEKHDLKLVKSLSFSGQMHGMVTLDKDDNVIRNAILWNDSRTTAQVDYLNNVIGKDKLIQHTSNIALCGFTAPKVLWLCENEKSNFDKIAKIMLPKDYLAYKLSGVFASDVSDLSGTLYFDVKKNDYSDFMLDILHINRNMLPKIFNSYDVIGTLKNDLEKITHLSKNCKIVIGGGDQAIGATGTNTLKEGEISLSLGTSGVVFAPVNEYRYDKLGRVHCFRHTTGKFHLMGCTLCAMGSLKWYMEDILKTNDYSLINQLDDNISDILFLPYLMGERSPINDPSASGYLSNIKLSHTRLDILKAIIEGICFSLYHNYQVMIGDGITANCARVIGGGTKSKKTLQILADIFGIEIKTINSSDGGALGAIICAMVGDGLYKNVEEAGSSLIKDKEVFYPNKERHTKYELKFKKYLDLYCRNKI